MPRVMAKPTSKLFEVTDDQGNYSLTVNQVTVREQEYINAPTSELKIIINAGAYGGIVRNDNPFTAARLQAYHTLGRVTGLVDENNNELFRSKVRDGVERVSEAMSESEFWNVWGILTDDVRAKIMDCIYEVNPQFLGN